MGRRTMPTPPVTSPRALAYLRITRLHPALNLEPHAEGRVEPIPGVLRDIFHGLVRRGVATEEPDYCVINFFNEVGKTIFHK